MKIEEYGQIRHGAELNAMKPYIDNEVAGMQKAVVSSVLAAVNNGTLTPEMALTKWMEYISYLKLTQKIDQRIAAGISISGNKVLDFTTENR